MPTSAFSAPLVLVACLPTQAEEEEGGEKEECTELVTVLETSSLENTA